MRLRGQIRFLTPEEGGRLTPAASGFRPQFRLGQFLTCCIVTGAVGEFEPGKVHEVIIELPFRDQYTEPVFAGMKIAISEGNHLIATGVVTSVNEG
jgi:translation elongation factor EF-Tu-like GTPase